MFDTNFTFLSGTSEPLLAEYNTSADISPFTSRCASPHQGSTSYGRTQRDTRYDSYRTSRPSITALTAQLESHALNERSDSVTSDTLSQADSEDRDEGFYDGPDTPATSVSDLSTTDFDPTLWDLSMSEEVGVTSSPRPSLSLEAQSMSSYTIRRRQRQALVRLQCLAKRTPDLAMLIEECHPSSLPQGTDSIWTAAARSNSTGSIGCVSGRIEKERYANASVRKMPRMRKRLTR